MFKVNCARSRDGFCFIFNQPSFGLEDFLICNGYLSRNGLKMGELIEIEAFLLSTSKELEKAHERGNRQRIQCTRKCIQELIL